MSYYRPLPAIYGRSPSNSISTYNSRFTSTNRSTYGQFSGVQLRAANQPYSTPQPNTNRPVSLRGGYPMETSVEFLKVDPGLSLTSRMPQSARITTIEPMQLADLKFIPKPQFGYHTLTGRRPTNEDSHVFVTNPEYQLSGIFDGHGGAQVSCQLRNHIYPQFAKFTSAGNVRQAIVQAVKQVDADVCRIGAFSMVGATSNLLVHDVKARKLIFANTGDSRSLIGFSNGYESSFDHKPNAPSELARLRRDFPRATVTNCFGISRLNGNLSLSRAVGDSYMKPHGLICDPDIYEYQYSETGEVDGKKLLYVVQACDGLWDVLTCQDIDELIRVILGIKQPKECKDVSQANQLLNFYSQKIGGWKAEKVAQILVNLAFRKGSMDNISCGVGFFVE